MNFGIILTVALTAPPAEAPKGTLVAVGGGSMPAALTAKILQISGGPDAQILVIPQSSERAAAGEESVAMWTKAGAKAVSVIKLDDQAVNSVKDARLIWIPGGDQNRLMKLLPKEVVEAITVRYREGAVVGGTSAGAAVLSSVMLTGGGTLAAIRPNSAATADGLGLWPEVIVDQHFLARQRFNRLFSAVLDRPDLVGVGVDESTAAIWHGGVLEVAGANQVDDHRRTCLARSRLRRSRVLLRM